MTTQANTEKLVQDLRVVVGDAEELLKATAGQAGEAIQKARARAEASLRDAKAGLEAAGQNGSVYAREAVRQVDGQVRAHPYATLGIAAAVGVILGFLIARK